MAIKVLIIGTGAIGGFYGSLLAKSGADVAVVCRSDYEHIKKYGIGIESHSLGFCTTAPSQVLKTSADYKGIAD